MNLSSHLQTVRIGNRNCLLKPPAEGAPLIVMLHGYGADKSDLAPLSNLVQTPGVGWVFPDAPLEVPIGPHQVGRAWFPIPPAAFSAAMETGEMPTMAGPAPAALSDAARSVHKIIRELQVPFKQVVLSGFSQGAMTALEVALTAPEAPRGLALLSTTLVGREALLTRLEHLKGLEFFQSHGERDTLLAVRFAEDLFKELQAAGLRGELATFRGGHEIPPEVMQRLGRYLIKKAS